MSIYHSFNIRFLNNIVPKTSRKTTTQPPCIIVFLYLRYAIHFVFVTLFND